MHAVDTPEETGLCSVEHYLARTLMGKTAVLMNLAIWARTRWYQYSRSEGLSDGSGFTARVGVSGHGVLTTLAWWNMYLSLQERHQEKGGMKETGQRWRKTRNRTQGHRQLEPEYKHVVLGEVAEI